MKSIEELLKSLRPLAQAGSRMGQYSADLEELIKHVENDGWISVDEALPDDGDEVLLYSENKYGTRQGEYSSGTKQANWHDIFGNYAGRVTHWKPLGAPKIEP